MAEDAKHSAADAAEQKGRQELEQNDKPETEEPNESVNKSEGLDQKPDEEEKNSDDASETVHELTAEGETVKATVKVEGGEVVNFAVEDADEPEESKTSDEEKSDDDKSNHIKLSIELENEDNEAFQNTVREQIENCKLEIVSSVQESVHKELAGSAKYIRKLERRRRMGFFVRDIVILILAGLLGFAIYCLYDAQYFDFMKPDCVRDNTCPPTSEPAENIVQAPEIVKDKAWYMANYGKLLESVQLNLNADKVSAYYLYSGDYRVSEIQPNYLLGMAYNNLNATTTYDSTEGVVIPAADMQVAFSSLFGTTDYFVKQDFMNGCIDFKYNKANDSFVTPAIQCVDNANRRIVEEVEEAYEEGSVLYFLTTAAIYDKSEQVFYTFDNLFEPATSNANAEDLMKYQASLNHYQYRFKKSDGKYYFSDIAKLK